MGAAERILVRFLEAKGKGLSLTPRYQEALEKLKGGDIASAAAFARELKEIILPGGERPDWFTGLSAQKMGVIKKLYGNANAMGNADKSETVKDPEAWARYLYMDMSQWAKQIRTLELASIIGDQGQEIKHGHFIVIPDPGLTKKQIDGALAALDEAADKIRPKFSKVLYGKVYLTAHLKKNTAAWYSQDTDSLAINVKSSKRFSDVFTITHELGHRHEAKFLSQGSKTKYWNLSMRKEFESIEFDAKLRKQIADEAVSMAVQKIRGQPVPKLSDLLVLWLKSPHPTGDIPKTVTKFLNLQISEEDLHKAVMGKGDAKVMTDKVLHGPLHVTPYGGTNPRENYADGFAHFCLGMDMPPELAEILAEESK
jgi:hypothetical protein